MEKSSQIIDKPSRSLNQVLPFKLRKKFPTQQSDGKTQRINLQQLKKRLSSRHKKMSIYMEQKFLTYYLGHINDTCRQKINKSILENIKVQQAQLMLVNLVSETFLSKMSEGIKSLHYDSSKYLTLLNIVQEVFKQILPIPKKRILIGQGQISQLFYVFFQNCFQQPFSLCCNFIIYLHVQVKQISAKSLILKKYRVQQGLQQVCSVKISLLCSRCNIKVLQLYGQKKQAAQSSFSPKKIHEILQIQQQRKKVKMSIMIGSGRFKKHRIDDFQNSKANIESFIDQNRYQSVKIKRKYDKSQRLKPITGSKSDRNAFFSQFSP